MNQILTVGHSNHQADTFLRLLQDHGVQALIDVRSVPASRHAPHFNRRPMEQRLCANHIAYLFLGHSLGGRPIQDHVYNGGGRAGYNLIARLPAFKASLDNAVRISQESRTVLMCSEREPAQCHRALLVAHQLHLRGVPVAHIRPEQAGPQEHQDLLDALVRQWNATSVQEAIDRQAQRHAHQCSRR